MRFLLAIAIVATGCKPSDEPDRRPSAALEVGVAGDGFGAPGSSLFAPAAGGPEATALPLVGDVAASERAVVPDAAGPEPDASTPDAAPDAAAEASVADATEGDAPDGDAGAAPADVAEVVELEAAAGIELTEALRDALSAPPRDGARDEARRLNKLGLEQHKKRALDAAIEQYQAALAAYPGFPFARYNLACALALKQQDEAALSQLAALAWLAEERKDQTSRDRLAAARIDPDFERLRDDPRFRELTGATVILVAWAASDEARSEARRLAKALRDARWPARVATSGWSSPVTANGVRVIADDAIAERAARAVVEVLEAATTDGRPWPIEIGAELPASAPPIVVLVQPAAPSELPPSTPEGETAVDPSMDPSAPAPDDDRAPDPAPAGGTRFVTLADALGRALRAERTTPAGPERHRLELKPTGFFVWDLTLPDGSRRHRAGRWSGNTRQLTLTFKETTEGPDGAAPATVEDQRLELAVELGDGLGLGGLEFR